MPTACSNDDAAFERRVPIRFMTEAGGDAVFSERNLSYVLDKDDQGALSWITPEFYWKSVIHGDDWPFFLQAVQRSLLSGEPISVSCRLDSGKSKPVFATVSGRLIRDRNDKPSWIEGFIELTREGSPCNGCRDAIIEGEKRAKEFCKKILAVLSHDIRSPLIGVLGMLQLLRKSGLTDRQAEYINVASESCERILEFAKNLLDFAKIDSGRDEMVLQDVNLRNVIDSIANLHLEQAMRGSVFIDIEIAPDFPRLILSDEVKIRQILGNLVTNAIKFSPNGTVTISLTHAQRPDGQITVILDVSDTGIGFDVSKAGLLFDQFAQMCQEESLRRLGAGLGLTIVKGLVELFKGTICVASSEGEGSSFHVSFPADVIDRTPDSSSVSG